MQDTQLEFMYKGWLSGLPGWRNKKALQWNSQHEKPGPACANHL